MAALITVVAVVELIGLSMSFCIGQQYEEGVLIRFSQVVGAKKPGLAPIVPLVDSLRRVSLRTVTVPIQSHGIIAAEGESLTAEALGQASDTMMAHPLALRLHTLQNLVEIGASAAMDIASLVRPTTQLLVDGNGLLAIDESPSTCDRRFRALGIAETVETGRARYNRAARRGAYGVVVEPA
jgi:hypothetical protein